MKKTPSIRLGIVAALLLLASCGGGSSGGGAASAPPVDLPAPITGRIDISEPDADGNVTVTGSAGAVTGGAMVIAVNETVSGEQALKFLDYLIPSAYAQTTFPSICSQAGRACALAGDDGSFVIVLPASRGDSIAIGLIDPTSGSFVSERVRSAVPIGSDDAANGVLDTDCAGLGLSGAGVDLVIVPDDGAVISLRQGSDVRSNRIVIVTDAFTNTVPINGCYANSLAVTKITDNTGTATVLLAATSQDDGILWTATYENGKIWNPSAFTLAGTPAQIAFVGTSSAPIVSLQASGAASLATVSLSDGSIARQLALSTTGFAAATVTDLDILAMQDGQNLGLAVAHAANPAAPLLTFFNADTLALISAFDGTTINLSSASLLASFYLAPDVNGVPNSLGLAMTDSDMGGVSLLFFFGILQTDGSSLTWGNSLAASTIDTPSFITSTNLDNTPVDIATTQVGQIVAQLGAGGADPPLVLLANSSGWLTAVGAGLVPMMAVNESAIAQITTTPLSAIAVADGLQMIEVLESTNATRGAAGQLVNWTN